MITIAQTRVKDGQTFPDADYITTPDDALMRFVVYELGYGGRVTDLDFYDEDDGDGGIVKVETEVLGGCIDTMTLTGGAEDMRLIVQIAALSNAHHGFSEGSMDATIDDILRFTKGNPRLIHMGGGMIAGLRTVRNICIALMQAEHHAVALAKVPMKDLVAAMIMVHNNECTLDEAVQLAT